VTVTVSCAAGGSPGFFESVLRVFQSEPNKDNADAREERGKGGGDEHPKSPFRHVPLGLEIAYLAFSFVIGFGISLGSFYRAGDLLYSLLDSQ